MLTLADAILDSVYSTQLGKESKIVGQQSCLKSSEEFELS